MELLASVLGEEPGERDAAALSTTLVARLDGEQGAALADRAWPALLEIVRGKLAVAKPGYDAFDFADELEA